MIYKVNVVFTHNNDGYYVFCPDMPGCHSHGDSFEEAKSNIREAIDLYVSTMDSDEISIAFNKEVLTATMDINVVRHAH